MGTGCSFPGGKQPGREADHSPPTSAEVKKIWICISKAQKQLYLYPVADSTLVSTSIPRRSIENFYRPIIHYYNVRSSVENSLLYFDTTQTIPKMKKLRENIDTQTAR
jgi:hypothetical protein